MSKAKSFETLLMDRPAWSAEEKNRRAELLSQFGHDAGPEDADVLEALAMHGAEETDRDLSPERAEALRRCRMSIEAGEAVLRKAYREARRLGLDMEGWLAAI